MNTDDMPVIELQGPARTRGRIYGESAKALIAAVLEQWRADLGNFAQHEPGGRTEDPEAYLAAFYSETDYLSAIQQWAPTLLEEVRGIAEGAEQSFDDILGLQLVDEEWAFGLRRRLARPTTKCTAFALPNHTHQTSYAGQNMDIGSSMDGKQVLLRIVPEHSSAEAAELPAALVFSSAGNIGLNGLNALGLGVTCNTLAQLTSAKRGLPVSFTVRTLLQQASLEQAEGLLRRIQHACGQNYILSTRNEMRCFECSATQVVPYAPKDWGGRVFHTNHPLVHPESGDARAGAKQPGNSTLARLKSISQRLGDPQREPTLVDIKAALSAHDDPAYPVSRNVNPERSAIGFTAGACIYELGDKARLHLAAGPPCETEFKTFDFGTESATKRGVP